MTRIASTKQKRELMDQALRRRGEGVEIVRKGGNPAKKVMGLKDGNNWWILSHKDAESVFKISTIEFDEQWEIKDAKEE